MLNLCGRVFNRLTVVAYARHTKYSQPVWKCRCVCGEVSFVASGDLKSGHTKSCGCYQKEIRAKVHRKHGEGGTTSEYNAWRSMKQRCYDKNCKSYPDYGGRGIRVYSKWKNDYRPFIAYMGRKPTRMHSIDRIDNDKGYYPGNVRWATPSEQSRNRRFRKKYSLRSKRYVQYSKRSSRTVSE